MKTRAILLTVLLMVLCCLGMAYAQEEEITLTTYYPAPYGEYDSLSIGSGYVAPVENGNLIVEGNVGVGTSDPTAVSPFSMFTVEGDVGQYGQITAISHTPVPGKPNEIPGVLKFLGSRGSAETPEAVQDGDRYGLILAHGYDGATYPVHTGGSIEFHVDGPPSSLEIPTSISFCTTATGDGNRRLRRATIGANGNVGIGTETPESRLTVTGGDIRVDHVDTTTPVTEVITEGKEGGITIHGGALNNGFLMIDGNEITTANDALHLNSHVPANATNSRRGVAICNTLHIWNKNSVDHPSDFAGSNLVRVSETLWVMGKLYVGTPAMEVPDYVFAPTYKLDSIEEHSKLMWDNKRLPAMPQIEKAEDGTHVLEVASQQNGLLEELEKAHIYIEQLNIRMKALEQKISDKE